MNTRFFIAKSLGRLPYFRGQERIIRIFYHPDKIYEGSYPCFNGLFSVGRAVFECNTASFIEWGIAVFGGIEKGLVSFLIDLAKINKFDYFFDVGANIGSIGIPLSYDLPTICFEPFGRNFGKLKINSDLNKNTKITLHKFALSDAEGSDKIKIKSNQCNFGTASLNGFKNTQTDEFEEFDIAKKIFDNIYEFEKKNLLFKVDVEGHEINVLRGMKKNLVNNKCFLYVETEKEDVINFLSSINYKFIYLDKNLRSNIKESQSLKGHLIAYNHLFYFGKLFRKII